MTRDANLGPHRSLGRGDAGIGLISSLAPACLPADCSLGLGLWLATGNGRRATTGDGPAVGMPEARISSSDARLGRHLLGTSCIAALRALRLPHARPPVPQALERWSAGADQRARSAWCTEAAPETGGLKC